MERHIFEKRVFQKEEHFFAVSEISVFDARNRSDNFLFNWFSKVKMLLIQTSDEKKQLVVLKEFEFEYREL